MSRPRNISKRQSELLRTAWHGAMSVGEIAKKVKVNARTVQRFWADEIEAGRLPSSGRPHFSVQCVAGVDDDADDIDLDDDAPIGGSMGLKIPDPDPLLAALHKVDPNYGDPQDMPSDWLRLDLDHHIAPTPDMLTEFRIARDLGDDARAAYRAVRAATKTQKVLA